MINFDTENIIIVCYPPWAGGKFLINCLGLNDRAVFQDCKLAQDQLDVNFTVEKKFEYLKTNMENLKNDWNDLNLGCCELFGVNNDQYINNDIEVKYFNEVINRITNTNLKLFLVAHRENYLLSYLKIWKNAKIIILNSSRKFVQWRTSNKQDCCERVFFLDELDLDNKIYHFNNNSYFSKSDTVAEVEKLYDLLELPNFDKKLIEDYYDLWMNKLQKLKSNNNVLSIN
jgi:hypothetical protein